MKFATLLALTGAASANTIQIDPFNMENFMKIDLVPALLKSTQHTAYQMVMGEEMVKDSSKV